MMEVPKQGLSDEAKRSLENKIERNREDVPYRDKLVANNLIKKVLGRDKSGEILEEDKKDLLYKSDYDRVREIALKERVSTEGLTEEEFAEEVRNLAMFEFALSRKIKNAEAKPTSEEIFKEIGFDLSELVSELMFGNPDKGEDEVCINIARVSLDEFIRDGAESKPYLDRVFDKISERFSVAPALTTQNRAMVLNERTRVVEVAPDPSETKK